MKKSKAPIVPNIVETYHIGGSTIHICDNFIRTDRTEVEKVLNEFEAAGWWNVLYMRERGEDI